MNKENITFRASQIGALMTKPRSKNELLSETGKRVVYKQWIRDNWGIGRIVSSKELKKGIASEEEAITRLSIHDGIIYSKNTKRATAGPLSGECDIFHKPENKIIDIKVPWDAETFFCGSMSKDYEFQGRAYMYLYDAQIFDLVFVLCDCPESVYEDEYRRFCWNNNIIDDHLPEYKDLLDEFRRSMKYGENPNIANNQRVRKITIERDDKIEEFMLDRLHAAVDFYNILSVQNGIL